MIIFVLSLTGVLLEYDILKRKNFWRFLMIFVCFFKRKKNVLDIERKRNMNTEF